MHVCAHVGFPWQYLGHFRRQETGPFASSQAIHTPHLPSFNCKAIKASPSHLPPCTMQCPGSTELMRAYHLFTDYVGAPVLKSPFLGPCTVLIYLAYDTQIIYFISFSQGQQKKITFGRVAVEVWVLKWAALVTFLCKSVPQDILNRKTSAPVCDTDTGYRM